MLEREKKEGKNGEIRFIRCRKNELKVEKFVVSVIDANEK